MNSMPRVPVGIIAEESSPPSNTTAYDNNNSANVAKLKQQPPPPDLDVSNEAVADQTKSSRSYKPSGTRLCRRLRLNGLWSIWYGFFATVLQAYIAVKCTKRFLSYTVLPWNNLTAVWELHACLVATGLAVILLPLFLASAVFKVGNYANDGYKLGRGSAKVSNPTTSRPCGALWRHMGPTAAFMHLVIAITLLVPRLVMEARLVQHGFLPDDALWRTDLDFMVVHQDRLVVLSFMTAASPPGVSYGRNITSTTSLGTHNRTSTPGVPDAMAMALSSFNASAPGTLEATARRSLAHDVLDFLKRLLKMSEEEPNAIDSHIEPGFGSTVSVEYLNYALALLVYAVRYPAVFWSTNKYFGIIFSIQLLANSIQSLLTFAGMSVLYKVQVVGAYKALPLLRHFPSGASPLGTPFLLNAHVTLALFALSSFLVLCTSKILYLYGHARYNSFLTSYKDRSAHITSMGPTGSGWGYRTHGAALAALIASATTQAPLLHDLTVVYRGSLDGAVLACIVGIISTLFLWVVVWLGLTIKYRWTFHVTITVGRATVRSARSVRLVTDLELGRPGPNPAQPLLVVGNGRAYAVSEPHSRKSIMSVVQKTQQASQAATTTTTTTAVASHDDDGDEQIYWLRPAGSSPQRSPDSVSTGPLCWRGRSLSTSSSKAAAKKVTFNEDTSTSQRSCNKGRTAAADEDDGDYATLRELPLLPGAHRTAPEDDEEGKLLACVHDDNVTYASTSRDLIPPADYEDPSPLLTPEPLAETRPTHTQQLSTGTTPRCLRRADSGMPTEELTPRSDSVSTESSSSPPPNHSETSSGVHSTASSGKDLQQQQPSAPIRYTTATVLVKAGPSGSTPNQSGLYGYTTKPPVPVVAEIAEHGIPAVILESDNTVVIRRKSSKPILDQQQIPVITEEPFSRSTNMKMTSFTEQNDLRHVQASSSATLPHYPTQVQAMASYPHCSTMPLPQGGVTAPGGHLGGGASCHVYPRAHTTLPTHHNGVRLFPTPKHRNH